MNNLQHDESSVGIAIQLPVHVSQCVRCRYRQTPAPTATSFLLRSHGFISSSNDWGKEEDHLYTGEKNSWKSSFLVHSCGAGGITLTPASVLLGLEWNGCSGVEVCRQGRHGISTAVVFFQPGCPPPRCSRGAGDNIADDAVTPVA